MRHLLNCHEPLLRHRRLQPSLLHLCGSRLNLRVICLLKRLRDGSIARQLRRVREGTIACLLQGMRGCV